MRLTIALLVALGCGKVSPTKNPDAGAGSDGSVGNGALMLAKPSRWVPQGGSATLPFTVTRSADTATGALTVHVTGLPAGVTAPDVSLSATEIAGTLTFAATSASALGSMTNVDVALIGNGDTLDSKPFLVKVGGAHGSLDTTFGTSGRVVFPLPDPVVAATTGNAYVRAVAQYKAGTNAGKLLVAVQLETTGASSTTHKLAVVRLTGDGLADTTFGGGTGYALVDGSAASLLVPTSIVLDSQERIVVLSYRVDSAGSACIPFVVRLTATGTADTSFTAYNSSVPGGYCGSPRSVAVLAGDKLEVVGTWNNPDGSQRPMLLQLNSDGSPDTTAFTGSNYALRLANPDTDKMSYLLYGQMLVDSVGHLMMIGSKCDGGWNAALSACESVVGRLTAAGAWDKAFGTAGAGSLGYSALTFGTTSNTNIQGFNASTFDAMGNIVAVGNDENYTTATIARFTGTTGAVDTSFGTSGRIAPVLVSGGTVQELDDVAIDDDGNVVAIGYAYNGGPLVAVTRYSPSGAIDMSYGTGGVSTALASGLGTKGLLEADGRLVVFGAYPRGASGVDLALWRLWP